MGIAGSFFPTSEPMKSVFHVCLVSYININSCKPVAFLGPCCFLACLIT
jgi:hypothetical protein